MDRLKTYQANAFIVAGFLILPLLLFGAVTLGSRTMLPADNLYQWQPWSSSAAELGISFPHNGLLSDLILENYAWKQQIVESVRSREIPLWNPNIFAGAPFLATGQHSAYYPFSILFLILPLAKAFGWFTVSQLWLAGVLTYLFGRVMKLKRPSATVAGLVFQGSGFLLVSSAVFPMILGAAVWLPLLLACIEMIIRCASDPRGAGKTLPWVALGAVALGLQILAGHIEITYYSLLVMVSFAIWRLISRALKLSKEVPADSIDIRPFSLILKATAWLVAFVLAGLMLGAIQLIPFVEVGQANFREGSAPLAEIRSYGFPPRRILTLLMPDAFGNPADHDYFDVFKGNTVPFTTNFYGQPNPHGAYSSNWGIKNYVEGGIYLGILPLILAGLGFWSAWRKRPDRRSEVGYFATLGLLSLSFIFGAPTYAILYYGLPGINQLHSPFRWVFPLSLCVAMLAAYGMDVLFEYKEESSSRSPLTKVGTPWSFIARQARTSRVALLSGLVIGLGLLLIAGLIGSRFLYPNLESSIERIFLGLERAADAFPSTSAFYSYQFEQVLVLALMLVGAGVVLGLSRSGFKIRNRAVWPFAAAVIIGLDLFIAGFGFNAAVDSTLLDYKPGLIRWLEEQPGYWRLTTFAPHGDKPLNANTPWLYGLQDVRGYDSIILKQYTDYATAIEPQNELPFNRVQPIVNWQSLNSPLLDLLGAKYILTEETIDLPKLRHIWASDGLNVYENLAAVPRAYTMPATATAIVDDALAAMQNRDPRQFVFVETEEWTAAAPEDSRSDPQAGELTAAEIVTYGNLEVILRAEIQEQSWLVLNDTFFTGWDAFARPINPLEGEQGEETQLSITRVNANFRGVLLEPGTWEVRFRYSPLTFKVGGLTSFMGGIIILFSGALWVWRRYYNPQGPITDTHSIAKNSLAPMGLTLFNRVIDFAFAAFYLRVLGPADAGRYATAIIIAGWFEIIANFGLNTLVIREVSKDRREASRYLLNTSILRLGTGVMASIPVLLYLATISATGNPLDPGTTAAIFLLMIGMVFSGMGQGLAGLFYAYEVAEFPAAIGTVTTILKVALGVVVLLLGYGFVGLAAVSIAVNLITLIILTVAAFRQFPLSGPWRIDFGLQRRMLTLSYPLMLNHLFAVIFFQVDVPLMRQINGAVTVGWYNSAYKWINAFNVIPSYFTFALFPVITRQIQSGAGGAQRTFRLSLKLMLLIAFPLAAVTTLMAPIMIGILGGREFLPAGAIALQLVVWSIPIGWMNSVTNYVLIANGLEKRLTLAFVIGLGFNVIANLLFLPRYGIVAASIITILSELVLLALFAYYLRPAMPTVGWLGIVKRPLAITAVMLWAMVLGSQVSLLLGLVLGLAVYPLGLWLLRILGDEERQILRSLLPESVASRFGLAPIETGE